MAPALRLVFAALLFGAFSGSSLAQGGNPVFWAKAGDWDVFTSTDEAGAFDVCFTSKSYKNDEMIVFFTNGDTATVGLFPNRWQLDSRDRYDVSIQAKGGTRVRTQAVASEDRKSVLFQANISPFILEYIQADVFYLHTGAGRVAYDITGAAGAIQSMARCALEQGTGP